MLMQGYVGRGFEHIVIEGFLHKDLRLCLEDKRGY
jgi:hypothetical protein